MDRRTFLTVGAGAAAALATSTARAQGMVLRPGEVLRLDRPGLRTADDAAAAALVDEALVAHTGAADPVEALARYVAPSDRLALKVNALAAPGHPFRPAMTWRLVALARMVGVPADRITVFDQYPTRMTRSGYPLRDTPGEVACIEHARRGYVEREVAFAAERGPRRALRWCRVIDAATAVINLCVPKDHDLCGVTGALKNMAFGVIDHVREFHPVIHHAIAWVYAQPQIRDKTRLVLCDAARVTYDGGPQHLKHTRHADEGALLIGEDPVAMDYAVLELVEAARARHGLAPVQAGTRAPRYLAEAVGMGLGAGPDALRWRRVGVDGRVTAWTPRHIAG